MTRLFNKKDEARFKLENELANTTQGNLSIYEYFLKNKNLYSEISLLNLEEAISEAQIRRLIIRGLKSEYIPYLILIQGWYQQPSLEEFKKLLSSQESLAKQMASVTIKEEKEVLSWLERSFLKVKETKIVRSLAKTTRVRLELVVSLLTLPLIRRFSNVIGAARLGLLKDFVELNYESVT